MRYYKISVLPLLHRGFRYISVNITFLAKRAFKRFLSRWLIITTGRWYAQAPLGSFTSRSYRRNEISFAYVFCPTTADAVIYALKAPSDEGLAFAKQKTGGEITTPQSRCSRDSSPDKGSLGRCRASVLNLNLSNSYAPHQRPPLTRGLAFAKQKTGGETLR